MWWNNFPRLCNFFGPVFGALLSAISQNVITPFPVTTHPGTPTGLDQSNVLFQEDFEGVTLNEIEITEERDMQGTWDVVDDGSGTGNDVLELSNPGDNSWAHIRIGSPSWDFKDGFIEFLFYFKQYSENALEDEASIDFYFRKSPDNGQSYIIVINPVLATVQLYVTKSAGPWTHLGTSSFNKQELDRWHLLRVETRGDEIKIYLDDLSEPILEINEDYRLPQGKISFNIREKVIVQLDNIKIVSEP